MNFPLGALAPDTRSVDVGCGVCNAAAVLALGNRRRIARARHVGMETGGNHGDNANDADEGRRRRTTDDVWREGSRRDKQSTDGRASASDGRRTAEPVVER